MTFPTQEPLTGTPDPTFVQYTAAGGALIPEAAWSGYALKAHEILDEVTFGRYIVLDAIYSDTDLRATAEAKVLRALVRTADELYLSENRNITSEKLGSYSVTYAQGASRSSAYDAARRALTGTGLTYAGIGGNARICQDFMEV